MLVYKKGVRMSRRNIKRTRKEIVIADNDEENVNEEIILQDNEHDNNIDLNEVN